MIRNGVVSLAKRNDRPICSFLDILHSNQMLVKIVENVLFYLTFLLGCYNRQDESGYQELQQ